MKHISRKTHWISSDGWRGYEQPIHAVAGCNDTGTYSDSPCNSNRATSELAIVKRELRKAKIPARHQICQSSNIFCAHRYLVVPEHLIDAGKAIVRNILASEETYLLYEA